MIPRQVDVISDNDDINGEQMEGDTLPTDVPGAAEIGEESETDEAEDATNQDSNHPISQCQKRGLG